MLLILSGHMTHTAYDGLEALDAVASFQPEAVPLEICLPKLNGYEVSRRLREQESSNRIVSVALTGWGRMKICENRAKSVSAAT